MPQLSFPRSPHPLPDIKALTEVKDLRVISHDGKPMPFREIIASTPEADTVIVVLSTVWAHLHARVTDVRLQYSTSIAPAIRTLSGPFQEDSHHRSYPTFPHRLDRLEFVIIGSGDPSRILPYSKDTSCEFPIFSDEGNHIHETLELFKTPTTPPRMKVSGIILALRTVLKALIGPGRHAHSTLQTERSCQNCDLYK
jgi:hypothetical protein